jgi:hypothetical protein
MLLFLDTRHCSLTFGVSLVSTAMGKYVENARPKTARIGTMGHSNIGNGVSGRWEWIPS